MTAYLLRRLGLALPQLGLVSLALFLLMQVSSDRLAWQGRRLLRPADRARLACQLGLAEPAWQQYLTWLVGNDWRQVDCRAVGGGLAPGQWRGVLRGDFGPSFVARQPAAEVVAARLPYTLLLMLTAQLLTVLAALAVSLAAAARPHGWFDRLTTAGSLVVYAMPVFWLALLLIQVFAVNFKQWGWPALPTGGLPPPGQAGPAPLARHLVLPVLTLTLAGLADYSRYLRASLLETLRQDYITAARARGLAERAILWRHALKNAALPLVTLLGLDLPFLLAGAAVTETIFAWPGLGRLFVDHLAAGDYPVIMASLMLVAGAVVAGQLLADLAYAWLDPRLAVTPAG